MQMVGCWLSLLAKQLTSDATWQSDSHLCYSQKIQSFSPVFAGM